MRLKKNFTLEWLTLLFYYLLFVLAAIIWIQPKTNEFKMEKKIPQTATVSFSKTINK